jgi:hypothetical protein
MVAVDDGPSRSIPIESSRLYTLTEHKRHEPHSLKLEPSGGLSIWSISFAAGVPE